MLPDLSNKRIIMIHGLASKPPEADWFELWKHCLIENIGVDDKDLAQRVTAAQDDLFASAYWANATPHHLEDTRDYVNRLRRQVEKVIDERRRIREAFHVGPGEKVGAFFKKRGLDLAKLLAGALTVKDNVMRAFLRETELYDQDQYIADRMRAPLEEALRAAWDDEREVAILSHSMGTFIAYDVLWRFSHRTVPGFKHYNHRKVKLFVTMGSPLGDSAICELLFAHHFASGTRRRYPTNIERWHNYAALGDVVAHFSNFEENFFTPMRELELFPNRPRYRTINYVKLHNPFQVVATRANRKREKRNPHKSYGYLVQPRLGTWLADFLYGRLR